MITRPFKIRTPQDFMTLVSKCKEKIDKAYKYETEHPKCDQLRLYTKLDNDLSTLCGIKSAETIALDGKRFTTVQEVYIHMMLIVKIIQELSKGKKELTPEEIEERNKAINEIENKAKVMVEEAKNLDSQKIVEPRSITTIHNE